MSAGLISGGLYSVSLLILGAFLHWLPNWLKEKRERKDRYFFALLEKRFEANQHAFNNVEKLKSVIHKDNSERYKVVTEVKNWYNRNNLYLEPDIRQKLNKVIHETSSYDLLIENWRSTGQEKGWDANETKEKEVELKKTFEDIMMGIQNKIQNDVNQYYKYLK